MFVIVLTVIVQFGMVYRHYLELTDAVRAGARVAAVSRAAANGSAAVSAVETSASDLPLGTAPNSVVVSVPTGWNAGSDVTVTATYHDNLSIFGMSVHPVTLTSSTTERIE